MGLKINGFIFNSSSPLEDDIGGGGYYHPFCQKSDDLRWNCPIAIKFEMTKIAPYFMHDFMFRTGWPIQSYFILVDLNFLQMYTEKFNPSCCPVQKREIAWRMIFNLHIALFKSLPNGHALLISIPNGSCYLCGGKQWKTFKKNESHREEFGKIYMILDRWYVLFFLFETQLQND